MDDVTKDSDVTIHCSHETPIISISIVECSVNYGKNRIIVAKVEFNSRPLILLKLYDKSKERLFVQFSAHNMEAFIKYHILFQSELYAKWSILRIQRNFVKFTQYVTDVIDEDEMVQIITNFHEDKINYPGLDDIEARKKQNCYWPNLRKSV